MNAAIPKPLPPPMPSSGRLIFTMALIAMISGFLIVLVYQTTLGPIARNQAEALERAVFTVLPGAVTRANFLLTETGLQPMADEDIVGSNMFAGYDSEGTLVGLALQGRSRGYADVVRVLYGYSLAREAIIGFTVLQSSETPGLGDKISKDPAFLSNFEALSAKLNESKTALLHDIETVKSGTKTESWQIDGISGATVSSKTVGQAIRDSTNRMVPLIAAHRDTLMAKKESGD